MGNPVLIQDTNLSFAWARAFLWVIDSPLNNPPPLTITLTGFSNGKLAENMRIRNTLNDELISAGKNTIEVSALVVFPYKAWIRRGYPSCIDFSQWCLDKFVPRLKARDRRNSRGLYFERMMRVCYHDPKGEIHQHNQLAYIIDWWREREKIGRRPRRSGLQVSCFDPRLDHNRAPRLVFPCLQQIGFTYDSDGGFIVNAFYPTQFIFDRAYGNYLGLCQLGAFMAHELGLKLVRVNCFIGYAELGSVTKSNVDKLVELTREVISNQEG